MPTLQFKGRNIIWNHHLTVPYHTLDEDATLSFDPAKGEGNIIVEGDNLTALKALLPQYAGKIDCIYIDPPYNTGDDNGQGKGWIYNDNVNSPLIKEWIKKEVGVEDLARHDKWLCMIVPRLKLLRELLKNSGYIFISMDYHELSNLKNILDEIMEENNFIEIFCWTKTSTPPSLASKSRRTIEYILCYQNEKNSEKLNGEELEGGDQPLLNTGNAVRTLVFPKEKLKFNLDGEYQKGTYDRVELLNSVNVVNGFADKDIKIKGEFKWSDDFFKKEISEGTTFIAKTRKLSIRFIRVDEGGFKAPNNLIKEKYTSPTIDKPDNNVGTNESASTELELLFGKKVFDFPKPVSLIKYLIGVCSDTNSIILDSFAGSGTTGQAVLELNKEDGGNRKFILVQMTEATEAEPDKNIARDITAERIKRAITKYDLNSGFAYYKLGTAIDAETLLQGDLPTYEQFAKYVFYLCTGQHHSKPKEIKPKDYFVGNAGNTAIYLIYEQDFEKLTQLALNLSLAEKFRKASANKPVVVYAPACFLDEEYLQDFNMQFVSIPYNLFQKNEQP